MRTLKTCNASTHIRDSELRNVLHIAAQNGCLAIFQIFAGHNELMNQVCNPDGLTPLHIAVQHHGQNDIVRSILDHHTGDIEARTGQGWSALHLAARLGWYEVTKLLLEHSAMLQSQISTTGFTPVHVACEYSHDGTAMLLLDQPDSHGVFFMENTLGYSLLRIATENGCTRVVQRLLAHSRRTNDTAKMLVYMVGDLPIGYLAIFKNRSETALALIQSSSSRAALMDKTILLCTGLPTMAW